MAKIQGKELYYEKNELKLQNLVASFHLSCEIDLKDIVLRIRNAEYNPRKFSAVILKIKDPRTTFLIFRTGKVICTGAKS